MSTNLIPPSLLRSFYGEIFDRGESPAAYRGARGTEEFLALARFIHPLLTAKGARSLAPAALAGTIPDFVAPPGDVPDQRVQEVVRTEIDLAEVDAERTANCLVLRGATRIANWDALQRWPLLEHLSIIQCAIADGDVAGTPRLLKSVSLYETNATTARAVLAIVQSSNVEIVLRSGMLDLRWIPELQRVTNLTVGADRIANAERLAAAPLAELSVSCGKLPLHLAQAIVALRESLTRLHVSAIVPFGPSEVLPIHQMKHLRFASVPAFQELRDNWIDFAVENHGVAFGFSAPGKPMPVAVAAGVHRGFVLLKHGKGARLRYEVEADLASATRFQGHNGDVEDLLRRHLAIGDGELSSENDHVIFRAPTKRAVASFIDGALAVLGGSIVHRVRAQAT